MGFYNVSYIRLPLFAILCAIGTVSFFSLVGCGGNAGYPDTAPVTGTVTLDGEPLEGAKVSFAPVEGRHSTGKTNAEGKYELRYTGAIKGAMLGTHRVMIEKKIPDPGGAPTDPERSAIENATDLDTESSEPLAIPTSMIDAVPERYRGKTSELSAEVKDTDNVIDFELTSK